MSAKLRQGAWDGALLAILIILAQPFYPLKGLIPELASFLTTLPLAFTAVVFTHRATPLMEGAVLLVYFVLMGALVGVAFEKKRLWGWLLLVAVAIHHYAIYDQMGRQLGEVVQSAINLFA